MADMPETGVAKSLRRLPSASSAEHHHALMALLGHRAATDYELSAPRYGEDLAHLQRAMGLWSHTAHADAGPDGSVVSEKLRPVVSRAQRFITLKEDAKHESLREVALLRRWMRALDHRYRLGGSIWFLTLPEIATLAPDTATRLTGLASDRRVRHEAFKGVKLAGKALSARVIERGPLDQLRPRALQAGALTGTRVSGSGAIEGRAVCVDQSTTESGAPIPGFETGDIIVARALHPAWLPELMRAGGVVVEVGGFLSHMAILARERGVTMSVGVHGLEALRTGARIRLEPDGSVVCV
jgi:rifampicin phosphotransferase